MWPSTMIGNEMTLIEKSPKVGNDWRELEMVAKG
jgi:hypothetical protein